MGDHRIGQLSCVREVAFSQGKALFGLIQIKDYSAKKGVYFAGSVILSWRIWL